jgi:hypothetical protein
MDWLNHPSLVPTRDRLLKRLRLEADRSGWLRSVIFLCGAAASAQRDSLAAYLRKHHPDKHVFYADEVWKQIAGRPSLNALEMEKQLAELSDVVAIVVQSPGTFAELGAFSINDDLRPKLLPFLELKYRGADSFVNSGPVSWIDKDSVFAPSIFADFSVILSIAAELDERLGRIRKSGRPPEHEDVTATPKYQLFLLSDLAALFGPAPASHFSYYLEQVTGNKAAWPMEHYLALGCAMGIIASVDLSGGCKLYYRALNDDPASPFLFRRVAFDFTVMRAQLLGILQKIEPVRKAITGVKAK